MKRAAAMLTQTADFAGRHPTAARETHGVQGAEAEPFQGRVYCPSPAQPPSPESIDKATGMVKKSGVLLFIIDADEHHSTAAHVSRSPILHSAALVSSKQGKNG
jgi:prephenate dehydrogenase